MLSGFLQRFHGPTRVNPILQTDLQLSSQALVEIWEHIQQESPQVASGLLAGAKRQVTLIRPLRNAFHPPRAWCEFLPDPRDQNDALEAIRNRRLDIIGIYYSTNDVPAVPSPLMCAAWPHPVELLCVIVPPVEKGFPRAFSISDTRFCEVVVQLAGVSSVIESIRRQFESNACSSLYTWIEAFNQYLREHDWKSGHALMEEISNGGYSFPPTAQRIIQSKQKFLAQHESGTSSPDQVGYDGLAFLSQMLDETCKSTQRQAILAMRDLHRVDALQAALQHKDISVQMLAAGALRYGCKGSESVFRACLEHRNWFVRRQAIGYLDTVEDAVDAPALIAALGDGDMDVREAAIRALKRRRERSALPNLRALLSTTLRDSNGRRLDQAVREALLSIDNGLHIEN